jgi:hypothetical protein
VRKKPEPRRYRPPESPRPRPGEQRRDVALRELLRSPLEDVRPRRRISPVLAVAAGLVVAAAAIAIPLLLLGGDTPGEGSAAPSTTGDAGGTGAETTGSSAATTTTLPGVEGYPEDRIFSLAAEVGGGRILLIGGVLPTRNLLGSTGFDDVWLYDVGSDRWFDVSGVPRPVARFGASLAFDTSARKVVLFGGGSGGPRWCRPGPRCGLNVLSDLWQYDPGTRQWTALDPASPPAARSGQAMVYDPTANRIVMFGGVVLTGQIARLLGDTWLYDTAGNAWTEVTPATAPEPRHSHAMVYDGDRGRILMWGGSIEYGIEPDTSVWAYDPEEAAWAGTPMEGGPSMLTGAALVWIPGDGTYLIGGEGEITREIADGVTATEPGWSNQVWRLDLEAGAWTEMAPLPEAPVGHAAAYDPVSERVVLVWDGRTVLYNPPTGEWSDRTPPDEG